MHELTEKLIAEIRAALLAEGLSEKAADAEAKRLAMRLRRGATVVVKDGEPLNRQQRRRIYAQIKKQKKARNGT
jgi:protein required for attachment to host cells